MVSCNKNISYFIIILSTLKLLKKSAVPETQYISTYGNWDMKASYTNNTIPNVLYVQNKNNLKMISYSVL